MPLKNYYLNYEKEFLFELRSEVSDLIDTVDSIIDCSPYDVDTDTFEEILLRLHDVYLLIIKLEKERKK